MMVMSHPVPGLSTPSSRALLPALGVLGLLMALLFPIGGGAPREDAAMLMRYADHMASGHGMVWNVGEAPVDGATDFLFTLLVAAVRATGVDVQTATKAVIVVAWALTALVVHASARRVAGAGPLTAFVAAVPVVIGPGVLYAAAGFGAPVFGLWAAVSAALALVLVQRVPDSRRISLLLGLSVLLLGLTRPEGVLLAALLAAAVVVRLGVRAGVAALAPGALLFLVLGSVYFAWRWSYFGHPLPNPYYKKGDAALHLDGLVSSVKGVARFVFPFALLWLPALWSSGLRRLALAWAVPIVGFTGIWVLISSETNYLYRFQYPVLVLTAVFWPVLFVQLVHRSPAGLPGVRRFVTRHRGATAAAVAVALVVPAASIAALPRNPPHFVDQRALIGELLAPYASRGYALATTEAGLLPLRSGWRALDTWGLNDQEIAHRGHLTAADLDRRAPVVVFVHQPYAPGQPPRRDDDHGQPWTDMTVTLNRWLADHRFQLVRSVDDPERRARVGHQDATWNLWVSPTAPDARRIAWLLACHTYPGEPDLVPVAVDRGECDIQR